MIYADLKLYIEARNMIGRDIFAVHAYLFNLIICISVMNIGLFLFHKRILKWNWISFESESGISRR